MVASFTPAMSRLASYYEAPSGDVAFDLWPPFSHSFQTNHLLLLPFNDRAGERAKRKHEPSGQLFVRSGGEILHKFYLFIRAGVLPAGEKGRRKPVVFTSFRSLKIGSKLNWYEVKKKPRRIETATAAAGKGGGFIQNCGFSTFCAFQV